MRIFSSVHCIKVFVFFQWQEVKDLFKEEIGEVSYVKLYEGPNGKPRGVGVLEFSNSQLAKKAIEVMNKKEVKGREIVVKPDADGDRDDVSNSCK